MPLVGCDFSSAPTRRKPIVMACGRREGQAVVLDALERVGSLDEYRAWLLRPVSWIGAFDFPFGLPRDLVEALGWPTEWTACITHYASLERRSVRQQFAAFCASRPVGSKFAHRITDGPAGASPSMKWVNPPVALMMHAGVPPLLAAQVALPGLHVPVVSDRPGLRVALEAYPGLVAREILSRESYKADDPARQTVQRRQARARLVDALERGETRLGLCLAVDQAQRRMLIDDASGDSLDAALCLLQAGWAERHGPPRYGLPEQFDPLEGWIITA